MKNTKPWCVEPFINLSHTTEGWHQLCCIAMVDKSTNMNTFEMSPLEYMNSNYVRQIRKDMIAGNISDDIKTACKSCILAEENNTISRRKKQNAQYDSNLAVEYALANDYKIKSSHLQYVNLKVLGNICNLKCVMCNPSSSSKIAAEYKKYNITDVENSIQVSYNDSNKDEYFKDLDTILESINRFSLIGGEAFVHPDFKEIFSMIQSNKNAKNIELFVITNGTVLPDYVLDNVDKFKKITLNFSIDGIGPKAEYIRNGTVWKEFDKNVKLAIESNANVVFTSAAQMLSIGYIDEICDYILSLGFNKNTMSNLFSPVSLPKMHNAAYLPKKIKQTYKDKYSKLDFYEFNDNVNKILKILDAGKDNVVFNAFIKQTKLLDQIRGNNLPEVFPEFREYYT